MSVVISGGRSSHLGFSSKGIEGFFYLFIKTVYYINMVNNIVRVTI